MSSRNFHLCAKCGDTMVHFSVKVCSWCEEPEPKVPIPCFQCGLPLGIEDTTGEHRNRAACLANVRQKHVNALREIDRLRAMLGRKDPVRCTTCSEIREREESTCGNCGEKLP